jgi:hypothetical protein
MTAIVTDKRGDRYLVDLGDGQGSIYDADDDILYPPRDVATLASSGLLDRPRHPSTNGGAGAHRPEHSPGCS